jgi:hypothetical protein
MSNWTEERRADRAQSAEQAREDRRLLLEAQLKAKEIDADQKRLDREAAEERQRRADAEGRRVRREEQRQRDAKKAQGKAAAAAKRARHVRWLKANPSTPFVAFVMAASIIPAVVSQVSALSGADVNVALAALLAAMLEGSAWAVTFMAKQAEDKERGAGKFRAAGWLFALAASAVNFWHGQEQYVQHPWVAYVLGASSLVAFGIWDLKMHGTNGRTKAERREAKEHRAAEKARAEHLAKRRKDHKDIAKEADRLLSALPFGQITDEEAFATAWRIHRGAEPGMSAELYTTATTSRVALGAAFELGEHVRPELLRNGLMATALSPLPNVFPTLGPVSPLPGFASLPEGPTSQTGGGLYAIEGASENGPQEAREARSGGTGNELSEEELEARLPEALSVAEDLYAEGKPVSARQLESRMHIRKGSGARLRDRVMRERSEYRTAAASGTARKSVSARIAK